MSGTRHPSGEAVAITVLMSFKEPHSQTNPYITQLRDCLRRTDGVRPVAFSWRFAITGRYDVFHAHWPESLIEQRGRMTTFGRRILYAIFLLRLWLFRIPVVRTVHNIELPSGINIVDTFLLRATESLTRARIVLNEFTPVPSDAPRVLIEHGHYREWFRPYPTSDSTPGRIVFFGKIRRYKNAEGLIAAFRGLGLAHRDASLHMLGSPSSEELARSLRDASEGDDRIELELRYADDADLVKAVTRASVVVLPYPEMHNSGSVLAALSLNRAVVVPNNEFNRALRDEVGADWVICYDGILTAESLGECLRAANLPSSDGSLPNLSRREWSDTGIRHRSAYASALQNGPRK